MGALTTIDLPMRGLTLLPPWPQAIAFSSKRLENRGQGTARQLGAWRGPIVLSQSKKGISANRTKVDFDVVDAAKEIGRSHGWKVEPNADGKITPKMLKMGDWCGRVALVAELIDVRTPDRCNGAPWHVPGEWGLILGQVWEVEPVECTGGVGAWTACWCPVCGRILADSSGGCFGCRHRGTSIGARPVLRVVRECVIGVSAKADAPHEATGEARGE